MAWPDCNCIGCVYREIAQRLDVGLFSAWGEWPAKHRVVGFALTSAQAGEVFEVMVANSEHMKFNRSFEVGKFGGIHSWTLERTPWYRRILNKITRAGR